jgi:hypothetical protein
MQSEYKPSGVMISTDYSRFKACRLQRDLDQRKIAKLSKSMDEVGFDPAHPIEVRPEKDGTLTKIRGHHRFYVAESKGLPIYYVEKPWLNDEDAIDNYKTDWTCEDRISAFAEINSDYAYVIKFSNTHKILASWAAGLLSGHTAPLKGRGAARNGASGFYQGTWNITNKEFANRVMEICNQCAEFSKIARTTKFQQAIAMALKVPDFDADRFLHKFEISVYRHWDGKTTSKEACLTLIENIYNHFASPQDKFPLEMEAKKAVVLNAPRIRKRKVRTLAEC